MITDEQRRVLHTPLLCLAFYIDTELAAVYPHTEEHTKTRSKTKTIPDVIETLCAGNLPERVTMLANKASQLGQCPECGDVCLSGQGVYGCHQCRWAAETTTMGHYRRTAQTRWETNHDSTSNADFDLDVDGGPRPAHSGESR